MKKKHISAYKTTALNPNRITKKKKPERVSAYSTAETNRGGLLEGTGYVAGRLGLGIAGVGEGLGDIVSAGGDLLRGDTEMAKYRFRDNRTAEAQQSLTEWYNPGKGMQFAGDATSAVGQSAVFLLDALIPGLGTGLFFTGITGQSVAGAAQQTGDVGLKELGYGVVSGAAEAALGKLVGAGGKVAGKLGSSLTRSTGKAIGQRGVTTALTKATGKKLAGMGWNVAKNTLADAAGEFTEEFAAEYIDTGLQRLFGIDPNASTSFGEALRAGAVGLVSGAAMGAPANVYNYNNSVAAGRAIREEGGVDQLLYRAAATVDVLKEQEAQAREKGRTKATVPEDAGLVGKTAAKGKQAVANLGAKITASKTKGYWDKLEKNINAYMGMDEAMRNSDVGDALLGELRGNLFFTNMSYAVEEAEEALQNATDEEITEWLVEVNDKAKKAGKADANYTVEDFRANKDGILSTVAAAFWIDEIRRTANGTKTDETAAESPAEPAQAPLDTTAEEVTAQEKTAATEATEAAEPDPWESVEGIEGFGTQNAQEEALLRAASSQGVPKRTVPAMLKSYREGTDLTPAEFAEAWGDGVMYFGRLGLNESAINKDSPLGRIGENARRASIQEGKTIADEELKRAKEKAQKKKMPARNQADAKRKQEGRGAVVKGKGLIVGDLDDDQYVAYKAAETFAAVLGTDIVIETDLKTDTGKRINGFYSQKTNGIHININAKRNGQSIALYTLGHEVTHYIKAWSPEKFKSLSDFVLNQLGDKAPDLIAAKAEFLRKMPDYKDYTVTQLNDLAVEEVVADSMELVLSDGKILDELARTEKTVWQKIKDFITKIIADIRKYYGDLNQASKTAQVLKETVDSLDDIEQLFYEGVTEAGERTRTAEAGVIVDDTSGTAMLSVDDIPKTEQEIDDAVNRLVAKLGVDESRARKWVEDEISLATLILRDDMVDYAHRKADRRLTAIVKNSDYKQGTLDFSNICRKRREYTRMMQRIQQAFPNRRFTAEEFATIRKIMVDEGLEVACGLCYVEDRRQNEGYIAETFQRAVEAWRKGNRDTYYDTKNNVESAYKKGQAKAMAMLEKGDYVPTIADLTTVEGMNKLQAEHKDILQAWRAFNNARGMSSARLLTNEAEYQRQILKYKKDQVKRINDLGGLRVFSFSDFEEFHLIDIIQAVQDCAAMGIKIQFYTKVPSFALLMADTKAKGNLSLIPKGDLGYEMKNGKRVLVYDPVEGIDFNDKAFKEVARGNPNIGTILVGINDDHIRTAMEDDFIDYIIPFHTGQTEVVRQIKKIGKWQNYKNEQVDKPWDSGSKAKPVNIYTDVIAAAERQGDPIRNERQFVERFLKVCEERGLRPRFSRFLNTNAEGKYVYTKGYYKLLLDFKMFDKDGTYLPQEPVIPEFDKKLLHDLTKKYVAGEKAKTEAESPAFQRALERVKAEVVGDDEGRMYSIDEDAVENLTEEQVSGWKKETVKKKELPKEVKQSDRATEASDFVTHMLDLVKTKNSWNSNDVYNYVEEHPELNFIDRIFEGDKKAKKDLEAFLNEVDDIEVLDNFSWYMGGGYSDKNYSWGEYPYRGAVRTFKNAVKKRINAIMTEQVGGTNLGIKNGDVSLAEVKDMFNRLNSNEEIGNLAEKVFATTEKLGVNIRFVNQTFMKEVSGNAIGDMVEYKTSYFNDTAISDQRKAQTILHELIHTCTVYVMYDDSKYNVMGNINRISGKSAEYVKLRNVGTRLNRIFNEIRNDPDFKGQYGTKNPMEMVAELANEEFVGLLKKKTLWDRIVEAIAELFGFSRGNTAYDNAMQCLDYLLDNPDIAEYKAHAKEQRQNARYNGYEVFGYTTLEDGQVRYSIDETTETPDVSDSAFDEALRRAGLSHLIEDTAEAETTETAPPPRQAPRERDPEEDRLDRIRAHETLANALMEAAQNEHEYRLVKNYREKAAELADAEVRKEDLRKKTAEVNREIDALQSKLKGVDKTKREPWVMTALTDAQKRKGELLDEMDALDEKLRAETDKLLSLASAKQLRKLIRAERSKAAAMERKAKKAEERAERSAEWAKETVKKAREESDEKVYKARREATDYKRAVYRTANAKADEKNQKYRDKLDEMAKQSMERREITIRMREARRVLGYLNTMLYHPTKQKHVPESLQALVDKALRSADPKQFGINRDHIREMSELAGKIRKLESKAGRTTAEQETLDKMKTKYEKLEADTISVKRQAEALMMAFEQYVTSTTDGEQIDENMLEGLRQTVTEIEEAPLNEMTLKSLQAVEKIYTVIYHQVNTANQAFATEKAANIDEMSTEANTQVKNAKELKFLSPRSREWAALAGVRSFLWKNMKPLTVFEAIGSNKLMEIFRRVLDAEDVWITDILEAKKILDEAKKEHGYNKWNLKERREVTTADGSKVSLTLGEMMSLYAYNFREQAEEHLSAGGFVFAPTAEAIESFKGDKGKYRTHLNDQKPHRMRKEDIAKMSDMLTEEQRAYAKAVQEYLTSLGKKGNEVSRKLYGIDLFKETAYFPIKSSHDYIETSTGKSGDPNIKSRGTFKETVPRAGNPIVLEDFMEVVGNHVNTMATYHAFVLPVEDLTRVWNYTPVNIKRDADGKAILDENGMPVADTEGEAGYNSLKAEITKKYGKEANDYILQLLRDLNGGARRESAASILDKGLAAFKRSATMLSLSTIIQQPTSIIRAMAYVDAKHFTGASFVPWETVKKYAPVAAIKEMGGFDTGTGARTAEYINAKQYDSIKDAAKAAVTPEIYGGDPNVRAEAFGWLTGKADEVSWRYLFGAIVNEQAEKLGKAKDSEEVLKAAGKRFAEVVRRTQVYDSTLTRSEYMRSKDGLMKMATAFGAEPTTVVSMAVDAIIKAERGDKTFLRKSAAGIAFSIIANAAVASLIYAMRDDDEDETLPEKYVQSVTSEMIEGFNPLEYLPIARDVVSMFKGYEIERSDMALVGNLMEQVELITSSKRSVPDKIFGVTGAVSAFFGLPVTNVYRDLKGLVKTGQSFTNAEEQTGAGLGHAMGDAVRGQFNLFSKLFGAESGNAYELYTAYVRGDTAHYERVKARYKTPQAAEMALRTELRDNDKRISEAAEARLSGDLAVYESIVDQIEAEGIFDRNITIRAINNEVSEIKRAAENGELVPKDETVTDEEETAESLYTASDLNAALERGDTEDFAAIMAALVEDKVSTGKTEAQAKSSVKSSITAYWKKQYLNGYQRTETRKRSIAILTETGLYGSRNDVATMCEGWVKNSK